MNLFLTLAFLFLIGSVLGWGLEVIFRRFFSAHHWVNPGFLVGPYLPLYGSSLCVLYLLAMLEPLMLVENPLLKKVLLFVVMALAITALEYVAGLIFIRGMKIKLWDYSDRWGNIQGIICPLFTFFWGVLSALYYFLLYPRLLHLVEWFTLHPLFSFIVGICFGVFVIDCAFSLHLGTQIRRRASEIDKTLYESVDLQKFQLKMQSRAGFFRLAAPKPLSERIETFNEFLHRRPGTPADEKKPEKQRKKKL